MSNKEQRKAPVLRFKGFTDDWEQRKFSDIAQRISTNININLPNVTYDDIDSENETLNKGIKNLSSGKKGILFQKNDILFGKLRPYLNNIIKVDFKGIAVGDFWVLRAYEDSSFLFSLINTPQYKYIANISSGSKMPRSDWNLVSKYLFCIPSEKEQSHIGNLILKLSQLITLQQQKNADMINLKKAILDKIFSNSNIQKWRDIRLNKVLSIPVDEPKEVTNIDDIISVKLNTQGISKIPNRSTLKLGSTKYYVRHGGQFIFGKQNFFNGSMAIIPSKYDGKVSSKDVPSLNINKDIVMPYFLWLYLSRPSFYKKTERWATGTGSKRLHIKDLLSLKIYIPNKNEQLRICKLMQSLDTQILKSQKHLKELQSIKKFLLQNMFI